MVNCVGNIYKGNYCLMTEKYLEIGRVINKRGLKGELKVEHYCDSPEDVMSLEKVYFDPNGKDCRRIVSVKEYKDCLYFMLEGIDSAEAADAVRGKYLYADRDDLDIDEDSVFISDIIGLPVIDAASGETYGILVSVDNYGASDVYTVKRPSGKEVLMPTGGDFIEDIDLEKGIYVNVIPGIFDDDAEEIHD